MWCPWPTRRWSSLRQRTDLRWHDPPRARRLETVTALSEVEPLPPSLYPAFRSSASDGPGPVVSQPWHQLPAQRPQLPGARHVDGVVPAGGV